MLLSSRIGDSVGIQIAGQLGGITASSNVGDLGGGEGDDVKLGIVAKYYIEIVKITSSRSEDEDFLHSALKASLDPYVGTLFSCLKGDGARARLL